MSNPRGHIVKHTAQSANGLQPALHGLDLVYYVRRLGCIKIGYSADMAGRLRSLRCTWADVVAVEFGGRDLERRRHAQFAALRVAGDGLGVEHYRETQPLSEHMRRTMADTIDEVRRRVA